jgi:glycosyltransferase involved in cell wall biosynthesis
VTLKALYVAPDPALRIDQTGGAGTHMRGTLGGLRAAGVEVDTLIGSAASAPTVAQVASPAVARRLPRVARELGRDLRLLAHGRSFASYDASGFDCLYERSAYLVDAGRPIAHRARIPYLVETDGILVRAVKAAYGGVLIARAEQLERRKIAAADAVVVMSEASGRDVAARYGVDGARILVKGLGVEDDVFELAGADATADVGFAGTFQPYHGVDVLVAALALRPQLRAVLVGDGPSAASVPASASIELPGLLPREETLRRLAGCRVLVVPHSSENVYPVKLLEYAALGRPVVCPDLPAFDEFERDGPTLHRFVPRDPADLARAIDGALAATGDPLRELVRQRYTWRAAGERVAQRMHEVARA